MKKIVLLSSWIFILMSVPAYSDNKNNLLKEPKKISYFGITLGEKINTKFLTKYFFKTTTARKGMFNAYLNLYKLRSNNQYCTDTTLFKEGDLMCIKIDVKKIVQKITFLKSYGAIDITNPTKDLIPDMHDKVKSFNQKYGQFKCNSLSQREVKDNINNRSKGIYRKGIFIARTCTLYDDDFNIQLILDLDHSGNGGDIVSIYTNNNK